MGRDVQRNLTFVAIFLLSLVSGFRQAFADGEISSDKDGRFSIFNIIKFENGPCIGGSRNGTCFTAAECESNGGTEDGTCADAFGVCCITILANGGTTALNQSYIVMPITQATGRKKRQATATALGGFTHTICPCSSDVCRIRFDFTTFTLAGPFTGGGTRNTGVAPANPAVQPFDDAWGKCQQDQFSVTGTSGSGTPLICGTNTGQHVFVDTDGSGCSTVNIGTSGIFTGRMWDIMVTQFRCGDEMGGPPGCLQYFTATTGVIRSFNFPNQAQGTNVAAGVTHLANQHYSSCIRTNANARTICYIPCTTQIGVAAAAGPPVVAQMQSSFGLSKDGAAIATSSVGTICTTDYITIPNANTGVIAAASLPLAIAGVSRFCGRFLDTAEGTLDTPIGNHISICTTQVPFVLGVDFDNNEITNGVAGGTANQDEANVEPGGIIGFCLNYVQM